MTAFGEGAEPATEMGATIDLLTACSVEPDATVSGKPLDSMDLAELRDELTFRRASLLARMASCFEVTDAIGARKRELGEPVTQLGVERVQEKQAELMAHVVEIDPSFAVSCVRLSIAAAKARQNQAKTS